MYKWSSVNIDLKLVTFCNDGLMGTVRGSREVLAWGPVDVLHEGVSVTNGPRCTKITGEHEARAQDVGQ